MCNLQKDSTQGQGGIWVSAPHVYSSPGFYLFLFILTFFLHSFFKAYIFVESELSEHWVSEFCKFNTLSIIIYAVIFDKSSESIFVTYFTFFLFFITRLFLIPDSWPWIYNIASCSAMIIYLYLWIPAPFLWIIFLILVLSETSLSFFFAHADKCDRFAERIFTLQIQH